MELNLSQFIGSEHLYPHFTRLLNHTDGIQYLAEKAGAFWLIDVVASWQPKVRNEPFQLWSIKVHDDDTATVEMRRDSGLKPIVTQEISYTDFPLKEFEWYVCDSTMLLKSEY